MQKQLQRSLTRYIDVADSQFYKAYNKLKIQNWISLIPTVLKMCAIPLFGISILSEPFSHFQLLLHAFLISCILQTGVFYKIRKYLSSADLYYLIAQRTDHIYQVQPHLLSQQMLNSPIRMYNFQGILPVESEASINRLSYKIQDEINIIFPSFTRFSEAQFIYYHIVQFWSLLLLIFDDFPNQDSQQFTFFVFTIGIYRYLLNYAVCMAFVALYCFDSLEGVYRYMVRVLIVLKLKRGLNSQLWNGNFKGHPQCRICLKEYQYGQKIVILKCSPMHHFHRGCLVKWVLAKPTCPLCRRTITLI